LTSKEAGRRTWHLTQRTLNKMGFVVTELRNRQALYPNSFVAWDCCHFGKSLHELLGPTSSRYCTHPFYRSALLRLEAVSTLLPAVRGAANISQTTFAHGSLENDHILGPRSHLMDSEYGCLTDDEELIWNVFERREDRALTLLDVLNAKWTAAAFERQTPAPQFGLKVIEHGQETIEVLYKLHKEGKCSEAEQCKGSHTQGNAQVALVPHKQCHALLMAHLESNHMGHLRQQIRFLAAMTDQPNAPQVYLLLETVNHGPLCQKEVASLLRVQQYKSKGHFSVSNIEDAISRAVCLRTNNETTILPLIASMENKVESLHKFRHTACMLQKVYWQTISKIPRLLQLLRNELLPVAKCNIQRQQLIKMKMKAMMKQSSSVCTESIFLQKMSALLVGSHDCFDPVDITDILYQIGKSIYQVHTVALQKGKEVYSRTLMLGKFDEDSFDE